MTESYKVIDYRVRPAKSIERKMLAESFRRMLHFLDPAKYAYIGMGSLYFADFNLFHRSLGFETMISVEDCSDTTKQARFRMNIPFGHIQMEFGRAGAVLQRESCWKEAPAVIWLDYDGRLTGECLEDLEYVASNAASGTVVLASVNADRLKLANSFDDEGNEIDASTMDPIGVLQRNIGSERVPLGTTNKVLSGWGIASSYQKVIDAAIRKGTTLHSSKTFSYEQIYNFTYSDGAKMLTVGGVLFSEHDREKFDAASFDGIDFVRTGNDSYRIDPPKLTYPEMRAINSNVANLPIPPSDVAKLRKTYRYFPHFIEAEVG